MKRNVVFYPFLLAAFPVLFLYGHNKAEFTLSDILPALGITLAAAGVMVLLGRVLLKDMGKAAAITALLTVAFFSYGRVRPLIAGLRFSVLGRTCGPNSILLPGYFLLCVAGIVFLVRTRKKLTNASKMLNAIAAGLIVLPLITIVPWEVRRLSRTADRKPVPSSRPARPNQQETASYPNIYYIILDGYGRADLLKEMYDYDNGPFLSALRQRGFYIARKARSNYWMTALSVPSTLNMDYLDDLAEQLGPDCRDQTYSTRTIRTAESIRFLKARGYKTVVFHSGHRAVEYIDADVSMKSSRWVSSEFAKGLLDTTIVPHALSPFGIARPYKYKMRRRDILYAFEHLSDTCRIDGPLLVVAHIIAPHEPFLFGANGEELAINGETCPMDVYISSYRNQLVYVNGRVLEMIDELLAKSKEPPVIVIAADHGPRSSHLLGKAGAHTPRRPRETFLILNAYYFPGRRPDALYEDIMPVNSFRLIFNHYFGADYELLKDKNYLSPGEYPFNFTDVTDKIPDKAVTGEDPKPGAANH